MNKPEHTVSLILHTGQRPDICSSLSFLAFDKRVDFRVPLILFHREKVISSIKNAENVSFKPVISIKMFSSTAIWNLYL